MQCSWQTGNHPQLLVMEAHRTLGVRVAPDSNNAAELEHLMQIATKWFMEMKAGCHTQEAVAFSLCNVVIKQLMYPLVSTMLTPKECKAVMKPILAAGLPAMGVVRTMARDVIHGLLCYQGLNIPNLYTKQMLARISTLLQYSPQADDVTGSLIRFMAEAFWLELRIVGQIFEVLAVLHWM